MALRVIRFRGKEINTGEWVYGFYTQGCFIDPNTGKETIRHIINNGMLHDVVPETIGQYTGLHDKNGKEIYEGDIVEFYKEDTYCINPDCEPHLLAYGSCINKETSIVEFNDCIFGVDGEYGIVPLSYCGFNEDDIVELKERAEREEDYFDANGYEIEDSIIGIKVIGNTHANPKLFNK